MKYFFILIIAFNFFLSAACNQKNPDGLPTNAKFVAAPYSDAALDNYMQGKYYSAARRYVLAKEHYLLALAASPEGNGLHDVLVKELEAVNLMIKTQR